MNKYFIVQDKSGENGDILFWDNVKKEWVDLHQATEYSSSVYVSPLPIGTTEVWELTQGWIPLAIHKITTPPMGGLSFTANIG
jgi:hypothetical protein